MRLEQICVAAILDGFHIGRCEKDFVTPVRAFMAEPQCVTH